MGPYAFALFEIVSVAEGRRASYKGVLPREEYTDLYRGLGLPDSVVEQYKQKKQEGDSFRMGGFTSTSKNLKEAIGFAVKA